MRAAVARARAGAQLPKLELTLLVGSYAIDYYLSRAKRSMTETVAAWRDYLPRFLPLPHPSWRTTAWERRNPWFAAELLPELRRRVQALLVSYRLASIRSMSSSLKPKWWPISWISTWRTIGASVSPVSHQ